MTTPQPHEPVKALCYLLCAVFMFETVGVLAKLVGDGASLYTIVFCRSLFATLPLLLGIWWLGGVRLLRVRQPKLHLLRGIVGFGTLLANFYAIKALPLATVTALQFTMPFFMMLLAAVWLHEQLTIIRWLAVGLGFAGALLVAQPESGHSLSLATLAALASALLGGISGVIIRRLTQTDHSLTIALSYSALCALFCLVLLPQGFFWPTPLALTLLAGAGVSGGIAQLLLTQAYKHAPVSVIAPYEYTSLLWAMLFGWIFWDHLPTLMMLAGALTIVGADLMVLWQEERRQKKAIVVA